MQGVLNLLGKGFGLSDVGLLAQFMEKKIIQPIEMKLLPPAFGKIGPQHRSKLQLIQKINPIQLVEAVKYFRG